MAEAPLHPVTGQILQLLQNDGCWYETFSHAPVRTSEEAAATRPGYSLRQGAKAGARAGRRAMKFGVAAV